MEIATGKTKVFGFVGTYHLRAKVIINDETLEQVNQFAYQGCCISYQFTYQGCSISYQFTYQGCSISYQFTYQGCSISYHLSNDVEFKLTKFLRLIGTIKRTIFKKVITETILKIYITLVLPTFLCGSENWTLRALQRQRIEAAEMKLLWQATPFVTTKQMTTYATNCGLQAY